MEAVHSYLPELSATCSSCLTVFIATLLLRIRTSHSSLHLPTHRCSILHMCSPHVLTGLCAVFLVEHRTRFLRKQGRVP